MTVLYKTKPFLGKTLMTFCLVYAQHQQSKLHNLFGTRFSTWIQWDHHTAGISPTQLSFLLNAENLEDTAEAIRLFLSKTSEEENLSSFTKRAAHLLQAAT